MKFANSFGSDASLHHLGVAVRSIDAVSPGKEATFDPIQRVRVAFFRMHDLVLELIEPAGDDSPVAGGIQRGMKLLHVCFEVDRLEPAIQQGRDAGFQVLWTPAPATAFGGRRIAWVYNKDVGLVELLERQLPAALDAS